MRKLGLFLFGVALSFAFILFGGFQSFTANADAPTVYIGGMSAGFTLQAGNPQIVGLCEVVTEEGVYSPALKSGLKTGDKIEQINGNTIETIEKLNKTVNNSDGKQLELQINRKGETFSVKLTPAKDKITGKYKIGVLVRDSVSGIGTVTFINPKDGKFGALGHSVSMANKQLKIAGGEVYSCSIVGVNKGVRGRAGELKGLFINDKLMGTAEKLSSCGIFGTINRDFDKTGLICAVADSSNAIPGNAYIYSTINGVNPEKYEIEVVKVDKNNKSNKNFVVKITDERLLAETGGIVQGMSGSPIVQNGKLIGAITHVFLNDPTRGYGIDIQTMLNE